MALFSARPVFAILSICRRVMSSFKTVAPYGSWKSPIAAADVAKETLALDTLRVDTSSQGKDGVVYWSELRPWEGGAIRVCSRNITKETDKENITQWTHGDYNARTRVHEYGGAGFFVHSGVVFFSNFKDQRLYKQTSPETEPIAITPADSGLRFADYNSVPGKNYMVAVREDHGVVSSGKAKEPENVVVSVNVESGDQAVLTRGADFYSWPRLSPDGTHLAWVQWKHPNMPWDDTELWIAQITADGSSLVEGSIQKVAGDEGVNVIQPSWSPSGDLYFISDTAVGNSYWSLYKADLSGGGNHDKILGEDNYEIGSPAWQFNYSSYGFNPENSKEIAVSFKGKLQILNTDTSKLTAIPTDSGYSRVVYSADGHILTISSGPAVFPTILCTNPATGKIEVIRLSRKPLEDQEYISIGRNITYETTENDLAHAIYYPPKSKEFCGPEGRKPPLIVRVHGGPTSAARASLNLEYQYYTTRGIGVLDINYRGSTGFGRIYRDKLRRKWGVYDVDDAVHGALYLSQTGEADEDSLAISGGSAGGYTVLAALTFKDVFKVGCSRYGVSDLAALAVDTHKFESRYLDLLIGRYPEEKSVYDERSPIHHVENLKVPVIFFQGGEDKVVPPDQSELMFNALKSKGIPTAYVLFPDEQHGFRKLENVVAAIEGELYFYGRILGFTPADTFDKAPKIENL